MEAQSSQAKGAQDPKGNTSSPQAPPSGDSAQGVTSLLSQLPIQAQRQLAGMTKERLQQSVSVRVPRLTTAYAAA